MHKSISDEAKTFDLVLRKELRMVYIVVKQVSDAPKPFGSLLVAPYRKALRAKVGRINDASWISLL
jgi:hypothetical protein